jgi:hypothetical protein
MTTADTFRISDCPAFQTRNNTVAGTLSSIDGSAGFINAATTNSLYTVDRIKYFINRLFKRNCGIVVKKKWKVEDDGTLGNDLTIQLTDSQYKDVCNIINRLMFTLSSYATNVIDDGVFIEQSVKLMSELIEYIMWPPAESVALDESDDEEDTETALENTIDNNISKLINGITTALSVGSAK